jgi:hypothetical protein
VASSPHAGLCYGVSLSEADRVSRPDADYQSVSVKVVDRLQRELLAKLQAAVKPPPR